MEFEGGKIKQEGKGREGKVIRELMKDVYRGEGRAMIWKGCRSYRRMINKRRVS